MSIISAGTADANRCGTISLGRHRNSTVGGTPTIVQDGDALGAVMFSAGDGTDMRTAGAKIHAEVDGTPGSNDMPGYISSYSQQHLTDHQHLVVVMKDFVLIRMVPSQNQPTHYSKLNGVTYMEVMRNQPDDTGGISFDFTIQC